MVISLPFGQAVPDSIPGYFVGFFSSGDFFHSTHEPGVSVFQFHLSYAVFEGDPRTLLTIGQGRSYNCVRRSTPIRDP